MQTAVGALKLFGELRRRAGEIDLGAARGGVDAIATLISAPLSSCSANAPSFRRVMTRRTDSSALSCTCRM